MRLSRQFAKAAFLGLLALTWPLAHAGDGVAADGTFTSEAEGRNGPVEVKVSIKEGLIADIVVRRHRETPVITREAVESYPKRMAESGYLGIEAVAGATETCDAIRAAVVKSIRKAGGDPRYYGYLEPEKPLP